MEITKVPPQFPYKCHKLKCDFGTEFRSLLCKHLNEEHFETMWYEHGLGYVGLSDGFPCTYEGCQYVSISKRGKDQHMATHKSETFCPKCHRRFTQNRFLIAHIEKKLCEDDLVCQNCKKTFKIKNDYEKHVKNAVCILTCQYCGKNCGRKSMYDLHIKYHCEKRPIEPSQNEAPTEQENDNTREDDEKKPDVKPFGVKCTYGTCNFIAISETGINIHRRLHGIYKRNLQSDNLDEAQDAKKIQKPSPSSLKFKYGKPIYQCQYEGCSFVANTDVGLKVHSRIHDYHFFNKNLKYFKNQKNEPKVSNLKVSLDVGKKSVKLESKETDASQLHASTKKRKEIPEKVLMALVKSVKTLPDPDNFQSEIKFFEDETQKAGIIMGEPSLQIKSYVAAVDYLVLVEYLGEDETIVGFRVFSEE